MLNFPPDLKPAYAYAYVTDLPENKEEEFDIAKAGLVFQISFGRIWRGVTNVVTLGASGRAERRAKRAYEQSVREAQAAERNLQQTQATARAQLAQQQQIMDAAKADQARQQTETEGVLARTKKDTQLAIQQSEAAVQHGQRQSSLQIARSEAAAEQQIALQEQAAAAEAEQARVNQPGISYTKVKGAGAGLGGYVDPAAETETSPSGLTV